MNTAEDIKNYEIIRRQEEELVFEKFDNEDAWKLGSIIVEEARAKGLAVAADIRINGYQVFRYGFSGTNNYNEIWLGRKIKSVSTMHKSTLRIHYERRLGKEDIYSEGSLTPAEYASMGGGFPICVKGTGVIGVVTVSGLEHHEDHDLVITGLCRLLGKETERVHASGAE